MDLNFKKVDITIIGLGYVGLPLAVEFSKYFPVTGYDLNEERISELQMDMTEHMKFPNRNYQRS